MFILAISCLTTSNFPWFMNLTFQVSMQYCSYSIVLFPPPDTFTTGCCFHFGSASSFLLYLFAHSFPVTYWAYTNCGVHLSVSYLFALSYCSWGSQGKYNEVVSHYLLQGTLFFSELFTMSWVVLHSMVHSSIELDKWFLQSLGLVFWDCHFHSVCLWIMRTRSLWKLHD